jgi:hypothetical protein
VAQRQTMRKSSMLGGMRYADQSQLNFFSLLLPAGLVSGHSLLSLYQSMLSVLTELGGGGDRAERVIRAVGEGLLRVSHRFSICPERRSDKIRAARIYRLNSPRRSMA